MATDNTYAQIGVRVSPEEKELIDSIAAEDRRSTSGYVRMAVLEKIEREHADRLRWSERQSELATWPDDALESRSDYLLGKLDDGLSPDDDRELRFVNRLLDERDARQRELAPTG